MKKFTKIMSLVLAMVLCVGIGVGATLAWLTDKTTEVVNTFAPTKLIDPDPDPEDPDKKAGFDIWEHSAVTNADGSTSLVKADSKKVEDLTKANTYERVQPGVDQQKDPFVRIKAQEDAYVYLEVVNNLPTSMHYTIDAAKWEQMTGKGPNGGDVYKYIGTVGEVVGYITPAMGAQDINILDGMKVTVDPDFVAEDLTSTNTLTFFAFAAQHAGQATAELAWANTFAPKA